MSSSKSITSNFKTLKNNGQKNGYTNQCLWISILDYLELVLGNITSIDEIRQVASSENAKINETNEEFDFHKNSLALTNVLNFFDAQIHFYTLLVSKNGKYKIDTNELLIFGEVYSTNIISIAYFGSHFELIIEINNQKLFPDAKFINKNVHNFTKDLSLVFGKNSNKTNLKKLKNNSDLEILLNNINFTNSRILTIEKEIVNLYSKLQHLEEIFINPENEDFMKDVDLQQALIISYQENKKSLSDQIEHLNLSLEKLKINSDKLNLELYKFLSN